MTTLQLNRVHYPVLTLGHGTRAGIWVQGCPIGCHGCMSTDTWVAGDEHDIDVSEVLEWLRTLGQVDGVTISGGEPFEQPEAVAALVDGVRAVRPAADVLVYSGYPLSALQRSARRRELLTRCDVVIAGPYVQRRSPGGRWRGSSNQRVVILTELGAERYAGADSAESTTGHEMVTRLQVGVADGRLQIIGVPMPGDLVELERRLGSAGATLTERSWTC